MKNVTMTELIRWGMKQQVKWARHEVLKGKPLSHGHRHQLRVDAERYASFILSDIEQAHRNKTRELRAAMQVISQYDDEGMRYLPTVLENDHFRHMTHAEAEAAGYRAGDAHYYSDEFGVIIHEHA